MDISFRVWIPENEDLQSVTGVMEQFLQQGTPPLPDMMQTKLNQVYGNQCTRTQRIFHCSYPRGPIRPGGLTGLRTHRGIFSHVASAIPYARQEPDIPVPVFTCAICLEECSSSLQQRVLPCGHKFHGACIERWIVTTPSCPECRTDIFQ